MRQKGNGRDFILYANEEVRRAIKAVNLFLDAAELVVCHAGISSAHVNIEKLHAEFPRFVKTLCLTPHPVDSHLYQTGTDGTCPAVRYYERAYYRPEYAIPNHVVYVSKQVFNRELAAKALLEDAAELGVFSDLLTQEHLMHIVQDSLENMGSVPIYS